MRSCAIAGNSRRPLAETPHTSLFIVYQCRLAGVAWAVHRADGLYRDFSPFMVGYILLRLLGCIKLDWVYLNWEALHEHHWRVFRFGTRRFFGDVFAFFQRPRRIFKAHSSHHRTVSYSRTGQDGGTRQRDTAGVHFNAALRRCALSHGGEPQGQQEAAPMPCGMHVHQR